MKQSTKEHLISAGTTFLTSFAIVIMTEIDSLSLMSLRDGTIVGLIFAGARAGIKAVIQAYLSYRASKK